MRLAFFASGGGSNMGALLEAIDRGALAATPALLVTDRPGIGALDRAQVRRLPTAVIPPRAYATPDAFGAALLAHLADYGVDFIALAGYLKHIPAAVVQAFPQRILNIHPSLLPAFGGAGLYGRRVHEAVLAYGVRWTGATVHLVDEAYDTGPIVLQTPVAVEPGDTPETLAARVLAVEHQLYPEALRLFTENRVTVVGRICKVV